MDLARIAPEAWRSRLAGAFQDFFRFEFSALNSVGVGDLPRHEDELAVTAAVNHAGADDVVDRLAHGLQTQLGPTWPEGVEISFGQWQKLALARAYLRESQVLILDEPTAALDARAEFEVFERFNELTVGKMALFISHRFSTVRMAERIIVLENGSIAEEGSHDRLMSKHGIYSEMFELQAASYR